MNIKRGPTCPRCMGECGFWGSGMTNPTLYCNSCGWNEEDNTTSAERYKEHLNKNTESLIYQKVKTDE